MHERKYVLWICLIMCLCLLCVVVARVSWQRDLVTARQGSAAHMTCIATDLDLLDVMRIELLASDGILRTIADTSTVKAPFLHIPRYVVTFDYHNSIGNLTITYQGMLLFYLLSFATYISVTLFLFENARINHEIGFQVAFAIFQRNLWR